MRTRNIIGLVGIGVFVSSILFVHFMYQPQQYHFAAGMAAGAVAYWGISHFF